MYSNLPYANVRNRDVISNNVNKNLLLSTSDKARYVAFGRKKAPPGNVPEEGRLTGSDNPALCNLWLKGWMCGYREAGPAAAFHACGRSDNEISGRLLPGS